MVESSSDSMTGKAFFILTLALGLFISYAYPTYSWFTPDTSLAMVPAWIIGLGLSIIVVDQIYQRLFPLANRSVFLWTTPTATGLGFVVLGFITLFFVLADEGFTAQMGRAGLFVGIPILVLVAMWVVGIILRKRCKRKEVRDKE